MEEDYEGVDAYVFILFFCQGLTRFEKNCLEDVGLLIFAFCFLITKEDNNRRRIEYNNIF